MAIDNKFIDDLTNRLSEIIPPGVKDLQQDVEKNVRGVVQSALSRMELVTREEFDVQTEVLARTRAKLEQLEKQVAELEAKLLDK